MGENFFKGTVVGGRDSARLKGREGAKGGGGEGERGRGDDGEKEHLAKIDDM